MIFQSTPPSPIKNKMIVFIFFSLLILLIKLYAWFVHFAKLIDILNMYRFCALWVSRSLVFNYAACSFAELQAL